MGSRGAKKQISQRGQCLSKQGKEWVPILARADECEGLVCKRDEVVTG